MHPLAPPYAHLIILLFGERAEGTDLWRDTLITLLHPGDACACDHHDLAPVVHHLRRFADAIEGKR